MKTLNDLAKGEIGRVKKVLIKGSMRRRFFDIGIVAGTEIECVCISPAGDPKAFLIKGAVIAIRNCDSSLVEVDLS